MNSTIRYFYPDPFDDRTKRYETFDLVSGIKIPRKKRFYKRDRSGRYFIPEVENGENSRKKVFNRHAGKR